ncbi:hypothetical protein PENTCL1PPCAC_180 [Pristionchus entomophagus]|uniref:Uncharacterized protein n=1 Tax=Pristionchus entomophagus TaxID=358040 RepID=A0AAV5S6P7_9BILA|nr:hypothetical protein PENTCL1PPCAC_180 [Pristionchus entomophagus]
MISVLFLILAASAAINGLDARSTGALTPTFSSLMLTTPPDGIMTPLGPLRKGPRFTLKDIQANWSIKDRDGGPSVVLVSDHTPAVIAVSFYTVPVTAHHVVALFNYSDEGENQYSISYAMDSFASICPMSGHTFHCVSGEATLGPLRLPLPSTLPAWTKEAHVIITLSIVGDGQTLLEAPFMAHIVAPRPRPATISEELEAFDVY